MVTKTRNTPATRSVALRASNTAFADVNYDDPSVMAKSIRVNSFEPQGAVGTLLLNGLLVSEDYNPDLQGDAALDAYDRMYRSDGQAAALLNVLMLPLIRADKTIEPASKDSQDVQIAQFVTDNLFGGMEHPFSETDEYVTRTYLRDGFSVLNKVLVKGDDGKIHIKKLAQRLNKTIYRWYPDDNDQLDRIQQRVWKVSPDGMSGGYDYPVIRAQDLVVFTHQKEGNNFRGISVFRPAYKHFYIKDQLERIGAIQAERMAVGTPVFSEPAGVQKSDRDNAADVAASLHAHQSGYVMEPFGWKFRFEVPSGAFDIMPQILYHSLQMVRSCLAQFLNLDRGGSYALSMDISTFFTQALEARADYLADVWNKQLIQPLVDLNWNVKRYPKLVYSKLDKRDIDKYLTGLARVLPWLTKDAETENAVRELLELPDLDPSAAMPLGGGQPTVETSGQGAPADPQANVAATQDANQQADTQGPSGTGDSDTAGSVELARLQALPAWAQAEVRHLLERPPVELSRAVYTEILLHQAEMVAKEAA